MVNFSFLPQGLLPVLVTILCLLVDILYFGDSLAQPRRDLDLSMFDWTMSYVQSQGSDQAYQLGAYYEKQFWGDYQV